MATPLSLELLNHITESFGDSFYILDSDVFEDNCNKLLNAFRTYYPKTNIAYSYKTNYIPKLAKTIDRIGGYAEVVSDMEVDIALKAGIKPCRIIWNGPVKNPQKVQEILLNGGTVNIDSIRELESVYEMASSNSNEIFRIGLRINYDVEDDVLSRFGFDVDGDDFQKALSIVLKRPNLKLVNLQAHFAKRLPEFWTARAMGMLKAYEMLVDRYGIRAERLDIGGGIYGEMPDELRKQLGVEAYTFDDYAGRAAKTFAEHFRNKDSAPELFIEPGTAVAANCMRYVCRVESIKEIRGKAIATLNGSQKNISMSGLNPPVEVFHAGDKQIAMHDADLAGYTCIESDYLYKGLNGSLGIGDYIVFGSCGSYSVVMKPPFILPNVAIVDISDGDVEVIKRAETFDDLFHTFLF